jgi:HlyD family secretion protein
MKKQFAPVVVLILMGAAAAVWWFWSRADAPNDDMIFVSGNIEATEVELSFRISGQIADFSLEEGDSVEAGQVLARLDTDTLEALKSQSRASVAAAQAALDELENGTREEDIEMAKASLEAAKSRLLNAGAEYRRYLPLFESKVISASLYDSKQTAKQVASSDVAKLEEQLRLLQVGPREEAIRKARANLDAAKWELKRIELDLEHSLLQTPISGVILTKSNEIGEVVLPGAGVATVAELDKVRLKGYVAGNMLGKLKLGQKVEITTDTFPGKVYVGRLTFISSKAEFTPKNVQTREERIKQVYRVKITIPNKERELKIGMPAEGYILSDESSTKLSVGPRRHPLQTDNAFRPADKALGTVSGRDYRTAVHILSGK